MGTPNPNLKTKFCAPIYVSIPDVIGQVFHMTIFRCIFCKLVFKKEFNCNKVDGGGITLSFKLAQKYLSYLEKFKVQLMTGFYIYCIKYKDFFFAQLFQVFFFLFFLTCLSQI
eukprot:TRINITY_DN11579_c0_g1_i1.p4 TRINITY_DN11579_c0_g1~~TRINITY_DN11579_c0_g1_i1.p4  ORF type:complete len:113 (-),score=4.60 TRINITY_DN11579_c0_g1_i1:549-887(-)